MAKLYTYDPQITGHLVAYKNGRTVQYISATGPFLSGTPWLVTLLPSNVEDANSFLGGLHRNKNIYVTTSTELKFNQPDTVDVIELPRLKISNPQFKTRQRQGEIVMSNYRRGKIVVRRNSRLVRKVTFKEVTSVGGWLPINEINFPGIGDRIRAAFLSRITVPYDTLEWTIKGINRWTVEYATGSYYEQMALDYPTEYPPNSDAAGAVTEALAEALSTQMDVLTEIAELPSTLAFIQDKCVAVCNAAVRLERKKEKARRRAKKLKLPPLKLLDILAKLELQYRYAVMPLVYSIQDARGLLEAYGYLFKESRKSRHNPIEFSDGFGDWTGNDKITCLVKQRFDPDDVVSRMHNLIGPNPVTTFWELTTLSFVVDWVVPIGDYLTALTTPIVSGEIKSSLARRCSHYCETSSGGLRREIFLETYERDIINPRDHIGLRVHPRMNFARWLDAGSLSWSMARNKLSKLKGVRI